MHFFKRFGFPFYKQLDVKDCGPACLQMIAKYYGKAYSLNSIRDQCGIKKSGVSVSGLIIAAQFIGLKSLFVRISSEKLVEMPIPCIAHIRNHHFVVIYKINKHSINIADPSIGLIKIKQSEFKKDWIINNNEGMLLLFEVTPSFKLKNGDKEKNIFLFKFLYQYIRQYISSIWGITFIFLLVSLINLALPYLTQLLVDSGINASNLRFIYLIIIAQLILYFSQTILDFIRNWMVLHLNSKINLNMLSDFVKKLFKLPIIFFDRKGVGDIMQRFMDHLRIQNFISVNSFNFVFLYANFVIFSIILIHYNLNIFIIFLIGSTLGILWIIPFWNKRKMIDYNGFHQYSESSSNLIQLIYGMQDIKLNGIESQKTKTWENIQRRIFDNNVKSLVITQYQSIGMIFFNQLKNIIITFIAAKAVIDKDITLGMMMAIMYIIGQLNIPITQLLYFFQIFQDTKMSLERIIEIHKHDNEESDSNIIEPDFSENNFICITKLYFKYDNLKSYYILENINAKIQMGKFTVIAGHSGSGKSTLLKLLLKFYETYEGEINIGNSNLKQLSHMKWRAQISTVLQDGFIFNDSIQSNICSYSNLTNLDRLYLSAKVADIFEFIISLPQGFDTIIGSDGYSLSEGQKQKILIARSIYKNKEILILDEPTTAIDSQSENIIIKNLLSLYRGKTIIVVTHRLSIIKQANKVIVLKDGKVVEEGTHDELLLNKNEYYKLIKYQL